MKSDRYCVYMQIYDPMKRIKRKYFETEEEANSYAEKLWLDLQNAPYYGSGDVVVRQPVKGLELENESMDMYLEDNSDDIQELKAYEVAEYKKAFENGTNKAWDRYRKNIQKKVAEFNKRTGLEVDVDMLMSGEITESTNKQLIKNNKPYLEEAYNKCKKLNERINIFEDNEYFADQVRNSLIICIQDFAQNLDYEEIEIVLNDVCEEVIGALPNIIE